jgi:diadenosine tetraphosphatase ApaH/serine/threonine PP2A family protein phosphatase
LRVAVIADIHANLAALEAVLEAIETAEVEEIWCLGDLLGYGAEPDACAELVDRHCAISLAGNHDLAVLGQLQLTDFSEMAAAAVEWTRDNVTEDTLELLRGLKPEGERNGISLFHGSPRDAIWEYVLSGEQAEACIDAQPDPVALIGHSHIALFFTRAKRGEVRGAQANDGAEIDLGDDEWLINPGSVGQPRDGDPRAAWLDLDTEAGAARFHRAPYDIERAAASISAAGLPQQLADRLFLGQ